MFTQARLIGALVGLAALIGAFFYGVSVGKDREIAKSVAALRRAQARLEQSHRIVDEAAGRFARIDLRRQQIVREIYRDIPTIVRGDTVYRNICISGDGVRALDRAAAAANGEPAGDAAGAAAGPPDRAPDGGPRDGESNGQR